MLKGRRTTSGALLRRWHWCMWQEGTGKSGKTRPAWGARRRSREINAISLGHSSGTAAAAAAC